MSGAPAATASEIRKRCIDLRALCAAALALALMGCNTQPVFEPGAGGSDFGTITAPSGAKYQITENADDTIRVEVESPDGNLFFSFGPDGKLTNITTAEGISLNFNHMAGGIVQVSGTGMFKGTQIPINFNINPSNSAKLKGSQANAGEPFLVCAIIDSFCASLEDLITDLLPQLIDEAINANLPAFIDDAGLTPLLTFLLIDPADLSFPTGNSDIDDPIRAEAMKQIEPKLQELRNFCAHWQLLRLLEISVCDAAGS